MSNVAFHDFPPEAFPMTLQVFRESDRDGATPVWTATVPGPAALVVPPLARQLGEPCWARIIFGTGEVQDTRL